VLAIYFAGAVAGAAVAGVPAAGAAASAGLFSAIGAGAAFCVTAGAAAGADVGFLSQPETAIASMTAPRTANVLFMVCRISSSESFDGDAYAGNARPPGVIVAAARRQSSGLF